MTARICDKEISLLLCTICRESDVHVTCSRGLAHLQVNLATRKYPQHEHPKLRHDPGKQRMPIIRLDVIFYFKRDHHRGSSILVTDEQSYSAIQPHA